MGSFSTPVLQLHWAEQFHGFPAPHTLVIKPLTSGVLEAENHGVEKLTISILSCLGIFFLPNVKKRQWSFIESVNWKTAAYTQHRVKWDYLSLSLSLPLFYSPSVTFCRFLYQCWGFFFFFFKNISILVELRGFKGGRGKRSGCVWDGRKEAFWRLSEAAPPLHSAWAWHCLWPRQRCRSLLSSRYGRLCAADPAMEGNSVSDGRFYSVQKQPHVQPQTVQIIRFEKLQSRIYKYIYI